MSSQPQFTGDNLPGRSIPVDALFADDGVGPNVQPEFDARQIIQAADVILGIDVMSRNTFIVFGREFLKGIAAGGGSSQHSAIIKIELDEHTDELARLVKLVETIRGRHEYEGTTGF